MEQLEKVEKLRETTGVTYEEAKDALEKNDWNILEAVVYLEQQGKIKAPKMSSYSTQAETSQDFVKATKDYDEKSSHMTVGQIADKFFKWCGKMIKKGCENFFEVKKDGKTIVSMPVILLILLFFCSFGFTLLVLIIGLFFGLHYSFRGEITQSVDINSMCDKASETCENIKKDFTTDK